LKLDKSHFFWFMIGFAFFVDTCAEREERLVPVLEIDHVTKKFGPVLAVDDVSFDVLPGSVHALIGENGAGKSTLVKIITGLERQNSGEIRLQGESRDFATPIAAHDAGIAVVYQDPKLFPHLDVAENIFMGLYPTNRMGIVSKRAMYEHAAKLLSDLRVDLDPKSLVSGLSVAEIQFVEIARALSSSVKLLILDEPTASLTPSEASRLFELMHGLKESGTSIIFISHRLEEIRAVADRTTVMRDGKHIITADTKELSEEAMVRAMVGRELKSLFVERNARIDRNQVSLEVRNLSRYGDFSDISFSVHSGEIVGLAGLVGAGRTEIAEAIFGLRQLHEGEVFIEGRRVVPSSPRVMRESGVAYVPEDRDAHGLIMDLSISTNVSMTVLRRLAHFGLIRHSAEMSFSDHYREFLSIKAPSTETTVKQLSGGNRQKVVFAKWLATKPSVLILDEPTHGIDVGSKAQVHQQVAKLAEEGFAVSMISSDLPEVLGMCDRILVMAAGRIVAEFDKESATQEKIMRAATLRKQSEVLNER
jgi:rhamnose transport system ATP-binding protein